MTAQDSKTPSLRDAAQVALDALQEPVGFTGSREIDAKLKKAMASLRAALALPELEPVELQPLTGDQISRAGRILSDRYADACGVDREDSWKHYGQGFIEDARAALEAAHGIGPASPLKGEKP